MEIISEARRSQTERRIQCRNNVSIPAGRTQLLPTGKEGNKIGKLGNKASFLRELLKQAVVREVGAVHKLRNRG